MATELSRNVLDQALVVSGHHSINIGAYTQDMLGQLDGDQRRCLGLLEAIDFGCFERTSAKDPKGIYCIDLGINTTEDVEQYLIKHMTTVNSLPVAPSMLGFFSGTFEFLSNGVK